MSDFGFQTTNDAGDIIADSRYPGYSLIQEGQYTTEHGSGYAVIHFSKRITSQAPPLVAIRLRQFDYIQDYVRVVGKAGNWTHVEFSAISILHTNKPGRRVVRDYRIYATGIPSEDTFGLRLYDENGIITLDTGYPQLEYSESISPDLVWRRTITGQSDTGVKFEGYTATKTLADTTLWVALNSFNEHLLLFRNGQQLTALHRYHYISYYNHSVTIVVLSYTIFPGTLPVNMTGFFYPGLVPLIKN